MTNQKIEHVKQIYYNTFMDLDDVLVGQSVVKKAVTSALLCDKNCRVLFTGNTGVGKTTLTNYLASNFAHSERISVTSDLLPSDIQTRLTSNPEMDFLHIDELNRASGKLQSAFIELFAEKQISTLDKKIEFGDFYVFATQNSTDIAGTFNVPSALYDRFSINVYFSFLSEMEKRRLLFGGFKPAKTGNISMADIDYTTDAIDSFDLSQIDQNILMNIFNIIDSMNVGGNPIFSGSNIRAHEFAIKMAKINALADNRDYILPTDLADYIVSLYLHRINQNEFSFDDPVIHSQFKNARKRILGTRRK